MKKHSFKDWVIATRPWSFPASAMPVVVTTAYLYFLREEINWINGLWALINIIVFHAAGNTWSDYFDYRKGVDASDTYGAKTLTEKQFLPQEVRNLGLGLLTIASVMGTGLLLRTGLPLLWIGLGGAACALLYPYLKYKALGDIVIFLSYAWLPVRGTSYVLTGNMSTHLLWIALPIGLITVAILHANNTRDINTDGRAGIRTFAMQTGWKISTIIYTIELIFPFVWIISGIFLGFFPYTAILILLALPPAYFNVRTMLRFSGKEIHSIADLDEKTAKLQLLFGIILSLSFFLSVC